MTSADDEKTKEKTQAQETAADGKSKTRDDVAKSWFCVFNNPEDHGYVGTPEEIATALAVQWVDSGEPDEDRTCAVTYCISAEGLRHCHAVFESHRAIRFSAIKKIFPGMHIEETKGTKKQATEYINKVGAFAERGEEIIARYQIGEIQGRQGRGSEKSIYDQIDDMIAAGLTPSQIFEQGARFLDHAKMIKDSYFLKRMKETPPKRDVKIYWHVGGTGSGKSYTYQQLCDQYGRDAVYLYEDYSPGGFDAYCGEPILFLDEYRGQWTFSDLMIILGPYTGQCHARYTNGRRLWVEVHITSTLPPEKVYAKYFESHNDTETDKDCDPFSELLRRITAVVYHWKDHPEIMDDHDPSHFHQFSMPGSQYKDLATLRQAAIDPPPKKWEMREINGRNRRYMLNGFVLMENRHCDQYLIHVDDVQTQMDKYRWSLIMTYPYIDNDDDEYRPIDRLKNNEDKIAAYIARVRATVAANAKD